MHKQEKKKQNDYQRLDKWCKQPLLKYKSCQCRHTRFPFFLHFWHKLSLLQCWTLWYCPTLGSHSNIQVCMLVSSFKKPVRYVYSFFARSQSSLPIECSKNYWRLNVHNAMYKGQRGLLTDLWKQFARLPVHIDFSCDLDWVVNIILQLKIEQCQTCFNSFSWFYLNN